MAIKLQICPGGERHTLNPSLGSSHAHRKMSKAMKLFGSEGVLLMEVEAISESGRDIHIKGKMMGQVPMRVVLKPSDLREALKMLSFRVAWQAVRMLFMRDKK